MRWITTATLGLALAGGVLAGCADSGPAEDVASAGGGAPATATSSAPAGTKDPAKFTRCLREHGVDVADMKPGSEGVVMPDPGPGVDAAVAACKQFAPATGGSTGIDPNDPRQQEHQRQFAKCMRAEGVDWPDPVPGQPMKVTTQSPQMMAAFEKCVQQFPLDGTR